MFNAKKSARTQRTQIEDITAIGEVLSEEQLRLVEGGCKGDRGTSGVLTRNPDGSWSRGTDTDF